MTADPLQQALAALATKLKPSGIRLIVGGGYGLVLRSRLLVGTGRTPRFGLTSQFPRATSDLDCFLGAEIITSSEKMQRIAEALSDLGFTPVQSYWMFERHTETAGRRDTIRIDLLAADVPPDQAHLVRTKDGRRVRPHGFDRLHARRAPEAVTIELHGSLVDVSADQSAVLVLIPHPISFILMKLFAFRDRIESADSTDQTKAPYHAFDVLMTLATMDAEEWDQAVRILVHPAAGATVHEARLIVSKLFGAPDAVGVVSLAEYAREHESLRLSLKQRADFVDDLKELLGPRDTPRDSGA